MRPHFFVPGWQIFLVASYGREAREPSGVSFIRAQISFLRAPPSCLAYILHVHAQSCRTLFDPVVCSPPGFSVHEILQAGILEWVAISSSRRFSPPRDQTSIFCVSCIAGGFFTSEPPGKPTDFIKLYQCLQYVFGPSLPLLSLPIIEKGPGICKSW